MTTLTDAEELSALRRDYGHGFTLGHDGDGTWWAVRAEAGHAPFEAPTADGLRRMLAIDEQSPW